MTFTLRCRLFILAVTIFNIVNARWTKRYYENYHRPHYYNKHHSSRDHVDYDRKFIEENFPEPEKETNGHMPGDDGGGGNNNKSDGGVRGESDENSDGNDDGNQNSKVNRKTHPAYYVHVMYKHSVICAGALITKEKVVTSTRCFLPISLDPTKEFYPKHLYIRTGDQIGWQSNKPPHRVSALYVPEDQLHGIGVHRVAVLVLQKPLVGKHLKPLKICDARPTDGQKVRLARLNTAHFAVNFFDTKVIPTSQCEEIYNKYEYKKAQIGKVTFCVRNRKSSRNNVCDTRVGDPLLIDGKLCGVNLYGDHCLEDAEGETNADVYVDLNEVKEFIEKVPKKDEQEGEKGNKPRAIVDYFEHEPMKEPKKEPQKEPKKEDQEGYMPSGFEDYDEDELVPDN